MRILKEKVVEAAHHGFTLDKIMKQKLLSIETEGRFKETIRVLEDQTTDEEPRLFWT